MVTHTYYLGCHFYYSNNWSRLPSQILKAFYYFPKVQNLYPRITMKLILHERNSQILKSTALAAYINNAFISNLKLKISTSVNGDTNIYRYPWVFPEITYLRLALHRWSKWKICMDNLKEGLFFIFLSYNTLKTAFLNLCNLSHGKNENLEWEWGLSKISF